MKLSVRTPDPRLSREGMLLLVEGLAVGVLGVLKVDSVVRSLYLERGSIPVSVESLGFVSLLLLVEGLAVSVPGVLKVEYVIHALSRGQDSIPLSVESLDFFLLVEGLGIGVLLFLEHLDEAG